MAELPIRRVVLYKHGVGYFERQGAVEGDATVGLTFEQRQVSDVLKSLTVLDLDGGHVASVSYDSTKPLAQLLANVALDIPDRGSLVGLLPQIKGARVAVAQHGGSRVEGMVLGVDTRRRSSADGVVTVVMLSLLLDDGSIRSFDLHGLQGLELLDANLRRDLDYYLRTLLSAKKKDARTFTFFAQGTGKRTISVRYTTEAPVWKATYRILLGEEGKPPLVQGWAVVDNTTDEDWEGVELSLVAGLPVSFVHDLYTPRYLRRPVVEVQETTGVLPPMVEEGFAARHTDFEAEESDYEDATGARPQGRNKSATMSYAASEARTLSGGAPRSAVSSTPAQVRERKLGDLFVYDIEHPVTIRRNQSALVPIVLRPFEGKSVLLHNRETRPTNPMRCVEFVNTTGLTLEGGPVTVLEGGSYVGEAMLETVKPDEQRLVPYAVELGVSVLDNTDGYDQGVRRVVVRDGWMTTWHAQEVKTTYTFHNKGDGEQVVFLDHRRGGSEWQLVEPGSALETTENYWRSRFTLAAKQTLAFTVRQHYTRDQRVSLLSVLASQLDVWVSQRYLDARTAEVLRQVQALNAQAHDLDQQMTQLREERERIHQDQGRVRENLGALADTGPEQELRQRFVRTLGTQEDRLEQIVARLQQLQADRQATQEEVRKAVAEVEYEAVLG